MWRGGHGQEVVIEVATKGTMRLSVISDRNKFPPLGAQGGGAGTAAELKLLNREHAIPRKGRTILQLGDMLRIVSVPGTRLELKHRNRAWSFSFQ